jgi:catechol 2,3-dioxygenase-like lactoylglutathione lyase family enzyme
MRTISYLSSDCDPGDGGMRPDAPVTECSIIRVHHVQLAMPAGGEDAARRFYSGVLGIAEVRKPIELAKRGGVWFETDGVKIHLGVEQDFRPARKAHPGLLVRDLQSLSMRLAGAGHEVTNGEPLDGYQHIYVNDPFGNRLELLEAAGARTQ